MAQQTLVNLLRWARRRGDIYIEITTDGGCSVEHNDGDGFHEIVVGYTLYKSLIEAKKYLSIKE